MQSRMILRSEKMARMIGSNEKGGGAFASSRLSLGQAKMVDCECPSQDATPTISESSDVQVLKDDEPEIKSESDQNLEQHSGDDNKLSESSSKLRKRKRYHRHTQFQIQEMERFFRDCPHPDDKQRKQLSRDLGLEHLQVKFWFQNKRTQIKTHHERLENGHLKTENERLRTENVRYRETITSSSCRVCGGPAVITEMSASEHELRMENARLRQEIERATELASRLANKPFSSMAGLSSYMEGSIEQGLAPFGGQSSITTGTLASTGELLRSLRGPNHFDRSFIIDTAISAMNELVKMAEIDEPLWISSIDGTITMLNEDEYFRMFPKRIGAKSTGINAEASRENAVLGVYYSNIIDIFMDLDYRVQSKWLAVFSSIVSRARIIDVLSMGVADTYDGAMHVISAEFQGLSPIVPNRDCSFVRYCKKINEGLWGVVDVSLDRSIYGVPVARCHRRPSGFIIKELPNGFSKVTWVEHVEVDDRGAHYLSRPLVNSGLAYGAKRWISILDRQCERLTSAIAINFPHHEDLNEIVLANPDGRKNLLKLSERMVLSFCCGVTSSSAYSWNIVSGNGIDEIRIMTRNIINDPGIPSGVVLSAVISFWLPVPPEPVFDFLRDESTRTEWDILSNGGGYIQEMAHIVNGHEGGNCVSLMRLSSLDAKQGSMMILQESSTDSTTSFVIFAPVDIGCMNSLLGGGNPDNVALLPSGFTILPMAINGDIVGTSEAGPIGTLLTIAFQILVDSAPTAKVSMASIATVNNLIEGTTRRLKAAFLE